MGGGSGDPPTSTTHRASINCSSSGRDTDLFVKLSHLTISADNQRGKPRQGKNLKNVSRLETKGSNQERLHRTGIEIDDVGGTVRAHRTTIKQDTAQGLNVRRQLQNPVSYTHLAIHW